MNNKNIKEIIFNNNYNTLKNNNNNTGNEEIDNEDSNEDSNKNVIENNNEELKVLKLSNNQFYNENQEENESNNNEIRTIAFSSNNENNLENIIFNNNNKNNIEKIMYENQNIIIEEEVAIKQESIIYKDDIVYLKELENQLLSEYPVTKQSLKFIQKDVENVAKKIIDAKNCGLKKYLMFENNIEYNFINDIINDKFNSKNIIPIVLDKHKIYIKLKDDDNDNINVNKEENIYFSESFENEKGIIEENQRTQFITLKSLNHERALDKIDYKNYLNKTQEIIKPYITKYNKNDSVDTIGFIKKPLNNTLVLRYYDMNNENWNTYNMINDYDTSKDILNELGKIVGIESSVFVKGDDLNIIGFLVLAENSPSSFTTHKHFQKNGNITKIINYKNKILIECKNHKLNNGESILIKESNSFPNIDRRYVKDVKVIDKNTLELDINIKLDKEGTYGIIYSLSKLEYDLYEILKINDELVINYKNSTYDKNQKQNQNISKRNKIYLFDNILVTKADYDNIIKTILPKLNQIIENNIDYLNKAYTFRDINNIVQNYNIDINSFNIEQINLIKNILKNNLEKFMNHPDKNIKLNLYKHNKSYFNDDNYFLSNKYINDIEIVNLYGKYIYINKPEDNLLLRLKWIQSQKDNGDIYYLNYLLKNINKVKNNYVEKKHNELQNLLKQLEIDFKKEKNINNKNKTTKLYKYQAYIITDKEAEDNFKKLKDFIQDNTIVFYKDNLYLWKGKLIKLENVEENSLALVGNSIWTWKKNEWIKTNSIPKYENIKYLCEFNNLDLNNVKLDSLDCIYRKDFGCHSKLYTRLQESILKITEYLDDYEKLNIYIENNKELQDIEERINFLKKKYYESSSFSKKVEKEFKNNDNFNNTIKNENKIIDNLSVVTNLINKITDFDKRLDFIFTLIDKDGLMIGDKIYSKKYKRVIPFCIHNYYLKEVQYADNPDEKTKIYDILLSKYSDYGETEKNLHICNVCGEIILSNDYDETEGFTESGMIKKSREIWQIEKMINNDEDLDLFEYIKETNLEDKNFKQLLLKYGLSFEDIEEAISISIFVIKNLFSKSGVKLPNSELIEIIIDCMQKIKNIIPYSIYRLKEIKKLQEKGYSQTNIEKIDEKNTFKVGYERYSKIRKSSIITSRFLISIQTSIPNPIRSSKSTVCTYYSFDGDEGITYMACILDEMNIILLKDKTKSIEILKATILEIYNDFKNLSHIRKLFLEKDKYLKELSKKTENLLFKNEIIESDENLVTPAEVGNEYQSLIENSKNIIEVRNLQNILYNRLIFLGKNIKKAVKEVIAKSPLSDQFQGILESSCCTEDALQYLNYYFYISINSNLPVKLNIDESNQIFNYKKYFVSIGSIHKFVLYDKYKFDGIYNNPIVDDEINTPESIIKAVFEIFVDSGIYAGTPREYIGNYDIKSHKTRDEILSKKYDIKEYHKLLREIEKHNTKIYKKVNDIIFQKDQLDDLKKDSTLRLDKDIRNMVNNVAIVLNKDKDFIQKYVDLFRNFGIFNYLKNYELNTDKDKIKYRELQNKLKLDYVKKFYITKLKKYLSIIKNNENKTELNIDLNFIQSKDIAKEIQNDIYKENSKLFPFLNEDVRKYFLDLELDYTNQEINSINGIDNIYDSNYDKIKLYSDFNFNDASNVMLYMLVKQLSNFIYCNNNNINNYESKSNNNFDNEEVLNVDVKNIKCRYICNFILLLFEELDNDNDLFNLCEKGVQGIENSLIHDKIEFKSKIQFKQDEDYFTKMMEFKLGKQITSIDYFAEELQLEEDLKDDQDKVNFIMEKGKKELALKYGYEPSDDQLETYKDDYIKQMEDDVMFDDEAYDLNGGPKGIEVLDQGSGYGELNPYDFDDEEFDYSQEQIE